MKYSIRSLYHTTVLVASTMFFIAGHLNAQKHVIEGHIVSAADEPIELATVLLLNKKDSVMAGFSVTNPKGRFKVDDVAAGDYILNITFLGYSDINKELTVAGNIDLGVLKLEESGLTISDIVVSAQHIPVQIKGDTVQYNSAAFKTRPSANVEELLKKLPGVEVDEDGTITAHGEEVESVLVEGKEFFGSDPTVATKNLPANAVDNVQVFDKDSDMAEFSGIDDGESIKTINLVLKEGKKAGYFGNASIGAGSDDRYEGKFNINRFTSKTQLSAIGMANNVNKQGFSFREYISFMGGLGSLMSGGGRSDSGLPIANGLGDGFVTTGAGGLNYNVEIGKKVDINSSYFFNSIKNDISQEVSRQTLIEEGGFNTTQIAQLVNLNKNHRLNARIESKLDSSQQLITTIRAGWNNGNSTSQSNSNNLSESDQFISGGDYDNSSDGTQLNATLSSTYMKRYKKKGRLFTANGSYTYNDSDSEADLNSVNTIFRNNQNVTTTVIQQQLQSNQQNNYTIKASYTEPIGKRRYLQINASRSNNKNDFDKDFYDVLLQGNTDPILTINEQLSNNYLRDFTFNRVGANIKFNTNSSSLTTGVSLQHSDLNGQLRDEDMIITQDYYYLLPTLFFNKDISASRSLRIRYNTNIREPSLEQLQPIVDNSNPLNIYVGNPNLRPAYRHNLRLDYNGYSQFSNVGFFGRVNTTYTKNNITNTKSIDEFFVQTTMPVNTAYALSTSLNTTLFAPLKFIRHRINISNNISYNNSILFVNGQENKVTRTTDRISLTLDNWKKDFIDIEYGTRLRFNKTAYSESSNLNQSYIDAEYFTNIELDLKKDWNFSTDVRHNVYSAEDFGDQLSITRWSASLSKVFLTTKKLRLELGITDILNQNQNINRSSNLNYIQDERIASIGRYVMLTVGYSFSGFGNDSSGGGFGRGGGRRGR